MTYSAQTDRQLVERAQKGDNRAFDMLVIKYQHRVLGLIGRYVHDFQETQDVAQEAFVKAYRGIERFRGDSLFYTWLYRIAINTAKNYITAKNRRPQKADIDVYDSNFLEDTPALKEETTPENNLYRDEIEKVIHGVIEELPDELRTAVMLREFDGLSYEDIADVMECPLGTVRSRIFRAREVIDREINALFSRDK